MKQNKLKVGNVGVVAVLVVVGVVTVGAIGLLFFDNKTDLKNAWQAEKVSFERKLTLLQTEKVNLLAEFKMLQERARFNQKKIRIQFTKLTKENKNLLKEKASFNKKIGELEEKLVGIESNTFFSDTIRERAELEVRVEALARVVEEKEQEVVRWQQKNRELVSEINFGGKSEIDLKGQLTEKDKVNELLSKYLANEKNRSQELNNQLMAVNSEKDSLARQLDQMVSEREYAQKKVSEIAFDLAASQKEKQVLTSKLKSVQKVISSRLGEIVRVKQALESTLEETTRFVQNEIEEIELEPIVVRSTRPVSSRDRISVASIPVVEQSIYEEPITYVAKEQRPNVARTLAGKVLVVNENLNFIVIDKGANQGVEVGMKFAVLKGANVIADIEVIEVRDNIAAADIQTINTSRPIQEGDYVQIALGSQS